MTHNPYANAHPVGGKPWSKEEDQILLTMRAAGHTGQEIADRLNRTTAACNSHASYLRMTPEEKTEAERRRRRSPTIRMKIEASGERTPDIPAHVLEDRILRSIAPRSITGIICGDPAIGFSALERRT